VSLRCGAYARYSTDKQRPTSIEDQFRNCRSYAAKEGWQFLEDYAFGDEAKKGERDDRAGLKQLIQCALSKPKPFDTILIDDTSRLSRRMVGSLSITEQLNSEGIRVIFVSQGIDTESEQAEVLIATHGLVDSLYIRELAKKVYRGEEGVALKGMHTGGRCFGYRNQPIEDPIKRDAYGRPVILGVRLVPDEAQAEIVRRIFSLYASGYSQKRIAKLLNTEGVPSPQPQQGRISRSWCPSSIRVILHNDRYRGIVFWARTRKVRNPRTGRRVKRERPSNEWTKVEVPEQRIVPDELWEKVQHRLAEVKSHYKNQGSAAGLLRARAVNSPYLFSGIVKCGLCSANMNIVSGRGERRHASYGCPLNAQRGVCKNSVRIRRDVLERSLLSKLQSEVLRPEVVEYTLQRFESELLKAVKGREQDVETLREKKATLEVEIQRLVRAIAGDWDSPAVREEISAREDELRKITARMVEPKPDKLQAHLRNTRTFVMAGLSDLSRLFNSDAVVARAELVKHIKEILIYPEGNNFQARGTWDFLGTGHMAQPGPAAPTTRHKSKSWRGAKRADCLHGDAGDLHGGAGHQRRQGGLASHCRQPLGRSR
jgi:DNA invertase Pin-like site-specific DNA recombinase